MVLACLGFESCLGGEQFFRRRNLGCGGGLHSGPQAQVGGWQGGILCVFRIPPVNGPVGFLSGCFSWQWKVSAKIRAEGANDDKEDIEQYPHIWAGVIPITRVYGPPENNHDSNATAPSNVTNYPKFRSGGKLPSALRESWPMCSQLFRRPLFLFTLFTSFLAEAATEGATEETWNVTSIGVGVVACGLGVLLGCALSRRTA